ncbi:hypothetical protein FN846DRAFT_925709 [Sphaerosporella brunnea]|uniref:Protein kinase domain-containing protein n=1 Tax=Sphaerosporella brunnea TaxID=1250544 RepID=A0A5J5FB19_9PEZI|nr:hypothetical protein FN846DRAFT_925709 [Sphaerosporella brunnea]
MPPTRRSLRNASRVSSDASRALPTTPARPKNSSIHPIDHTPVTTNSDGQRLRASQTSTGQRFTSSGPDQMPSNARRDEMDPLLLAELAGRVSRDVHGFEDAFFPASDDIRELFDWAVDASIYDRSTSRWRSWPAIPNEGNVLAFFQNTVDNVLLRQLNANAGVRSYPYVPSNSLLIRGGDCRRKTDLLISTYIPNAPALPAPDFKLDFITLRRNRYDWRTIRVIGELKANPDESDSDSTLAQLANYVREIFNAQPSRRWVHSFTLCGQNLRAWLFDRSGATTSRLIDINAEPELFLRVVCRYALMDSTAVGFDPSIKWLWNGVERPYDPTVAHALAIAPPRRSPSTSRPYLYTPLGPVDGSLPAKLEIDPCPLFNRRSIVTRGSVCWKARDYPESSKSASAPDARWPYVVKDQWRAAERPSECDIISSMQRSDRQADLDLGLPEYVGYADHTEDGKPVDIITTVRRGCGSIPRPPCSSKPTSMAPPVCTQPLTRGKKRRSTTEEQSESKRFKHDEPSPTCNNRIFSRLVMTPFGRAIDTFTTITELFEALRDAIRGHRTLYNTHQILHRDVSLFNILIDDDSSRPGKGVLIDLDLAIRRERTQATGASHRTGTQDFMAPGLLSGNPHCFRHDLESFFYVLLWIATYYTVPAGDGSPTELRHQRVKSIFDACDNMLYRDFSLMAVMKAGFVQSPHSFEKRCLGVLDDDMYDALGPLLEQWRDTLYPPGYCIDYSPTSPDEEGDLWQRMIDACQAQIDGLGGR